MFERFVFDGISCDEYGVTCVTFSSSAMNAISAQQTNLKTEKSIRGDIYHITSQGYSEPLTYTMQIINRDFSPISATQERTLKKWLCQRDTYKPLCILEKHYADIWFYANINNPKSIYVVDTVGLELTVTTNAPFAFSDIRHKIWVLEADGAINDFYVDNDEAFPIYPDLTVTTAEAGAFSLVNTSIAHNPNTLTIDNCSAGEMIHLECAYPFISSCNASHNVFDDFNKWWPYLIDGYNRITVNKPCTLEFQYREYRKVAIV